MKINKKLILLILFIVFNYSYVNAQIYKYESKQVSKRLKIKNIYKDSLSNENSIHIYAVNNSIRHYFKKKYVFDIILLKDSIKKIAKDEDDFYNKLKPGKVYRMKLQRVLEISNKDDVFWRVNNGFILLNGKNEFEYYIEKVYILKDIKF